MKPGAGASKGAAFERWVCKRLSSWAGGPDDLFWRTAGSGARQTQGRHRTNQAGDIAALDRKVKWFTDKFYVECKFYRKLDWEAFIFKGRGHIKLWWDKALEQASQLNRWPLLICKQNGLEPVILYHKNLDLTLEPVILYQRDILITIPPESVQVEWLEMFLSETPDWLRKRVERLEAGMKRVPL